MRRSRYLPPILLQVIGVLLLVAVAINWKVTGNQSALLVGAALSLIGLGAYSGLHISISQELSPEEEAPEKDEP